MSQPPSARPAYKRPMKLSTALALMMGAVLLCVLLCVHLLYFFQMGNLAHTRVKDKALAVARTLASQPALQQALSLPPDAGILQPIARQVQRSNDLLFVVVTNMQGTRYSHPNAQLIGQPFSGNDLQPALLGEENSSINHGQLAEALRVFTPVYDASHQQIGVVAIGIALTDVTQQIDESRASIFWTVLLGILVGATGILVLERRLKRILFGLEPHEISTLFEQRQAMLQSITEGVIAVDSQARVTLINQTARQLIGGSALQQPHWQQSLSDSSPLLTSLRTVLQSGEARRDRELNLNGRQLLSNTVPVHSNGQIIGAICTFRDKTEVSQLMQRLSGMMSYADALRLRAHEFMNKLHVILGLLHLKNYPQLENYILKTASNYQTEIGALLEKVRSPVIAGFLLSKISRASDDGIAFTLDDASQLPDCGSEQQIGVLITVLGNLLDNALEALAGQPEGEIRLLLHYQNGWLTCEVSDDGPGIAASQLEAIFRKGVSAKGEHRGVGLWLVREQTESLGGSVLVESEPGVYTQFLLQLPWDGEHSAND